MLIYFYRNAETLTEECITELLQDLPQQQQQIVAGIKNHRHRCEQVVAYIMLCHALKRQRYWIPDPDSYLVRRFPPELLTSRYVKQNPPLWSFGEHGKPYMTNYEGIYFNISHCNEAVAVAVSDREVGIDVEGRRKFSDSLLQRAFNEEEQTLVRSAKDPEEEFARIWTRKEAWFKWTGTGILINHLKSTEADAKAANCDIHTMPVVGGDFFWLSIAKATTARITCTG